MKKLLLSTLIAGSIATVYAAPFIVEDIRIDGTRPETGKAIISGIPLKIGQKATDNDIANVVRKLFSQEKFADVRAVREGNTLVIKVTEFPLINKIEIEGNSAIPKEPLEQNLTSNLIKKGEIYNAERLNGFKEALLNQYHSMGRYNTIIDIVTNKTDKGIDVKLAIQEGEIAYVKAINFEGNKDFSEKNLVKLLDIKPDVSWWNIFQSSKFEQRVYTQDLENLRDFYMNQGYAKYHLLDSHIQFSEDKKEVNLTYKIEEGDVYRISDIKISGNTANLDNDLNALLKDFIKGDIFRKNELEKIEDGIKSILGEKGFGSPKIDIIPIFDEENKTVRINYIVDAGARIYVRQIRFEGNNVTADSTLRREMRQQEGAWLSTTAAQLGKARLERTGFYESVELSYVDVPSVSDQVDLLYKIKERNTGSVNFSIGYGSEGGLSYQTGIKQDNFLGMGSTISLSGLRNDYSTSINLGYSEPYFTEDGVSLGGNIFYEDYDNSKNKSSSKYQRRTYGANSTLGFPVNENNSYYIGLGFTRDKIKNTEREFTRELYVRSMEFPYNLDSNVYPKIKANDFDLSFGWNYNSLNRGYFPTEGSAANLGGKITIPGSTNKYYKLSADFRNYLPLNREHRWIISTKAGVGYANGFGGKNLPFYQQYTAGGIGSLRGFEYGAIGPKAIYYSPADPNDHHSKAGFFRDSSDVIGGNAIATAGIELITPTPFVSDKYQHKVRTSLFIDAATVWNTKWKQEPTLDGHKYNFKHLENFKDYKRVRASAGVGFEWLSPIGPISFSYAKPLKKYKDDVIEQFQFSIGGSF